MASKPEDSNTIKSDETLFDIIDALRESGGGGVTYLADELGLAKSTVYKHLQSLQGRGYVVNDGGEYRLGLQFFNQGAFVRNQFALYHASKNKIEKLASRTGETVWCIVQENGRGMFLNGAAANDTLAPDSVIGRWLPLHSSAAGKAILAYLPEDDVHDIIDRQGLPAYSDNTITNREELFEDLERVRDRGYAYNFEENETGVHAIAAPVGRDGAPVGAISIAGAANRLTRQYCDDELADPLLETVDDIEFQLAYD